MLKDALIPEKIERSADGHGLVATISDTEAEKLNPTNAGDLFKKVTAAGNVELSAPSIHIEAPVISLGSEQEVDPLAPASAPAPTLDTGRPVSTPISQMDVSYGNPRGRLRREHPYGRPANLSEKIEVKEEDPVHFKRRADYHNALVDMKAIADKKLAAEGRRWAPNDRVWDWLRGNLKNMEHFINSGYVAELLVDNDVALWLFVRKHGQEASTDTLAAAIAHIRKQMIIYRARLSAIRAKHVTRRGSTYDAIELTRAIEIAHEYVKFGEEFERDVTAPNVEIVLKFDEAGVDTSAVTPIDDNRITFPIKKAVLDELNAERAAASHKKLEGIAQ